ncbi:MAG: TauD/TfdA family dioxygenase [Chroococcidiopsidaceae cyanobacterium CP_BM_RX_35]|nr:TauD/TfdA family dioxygenase [Chroococcidiopsidaceae cyanobacterium CP_BM_RX_35]
MMKEQAHDTPNIRNVTRKAIGVSEAELIKIEPLHSGDSLPLKILPSIDGVDLIAWAAHNQELIETQLLKYGAILFRNFNVKDVSKFEQFIKITSGELMEYCERSSPRSQVVGNIYTSTDYPANESIFLHNEHSYSQTFPLRLFFFCVKPASQGGETPLADCRKVFKCMNPSLRDRFIQKKWMYVRNFGDGFGLPWQTVFQTADKKLVEDYCRRSNIELEWKDENRLRTRQVRPVITRHPYTGEMIWFNHIIFFHVSTLKPTMREALLKEFRNEDLPNNTYYGDGSPIEPSVLDELRHIYEQEMVIFSWQQGDILMLDNMQTAHGRMPFIGSRKVLFAMAKSFTREDT